jgi:hypothetical protein
MTKTICKKLANSKEPPITSKKIPKEPGIYAIIEKNMTGEPKWLYAGKSNNVERRIGEHLRRKRQAIDKKIAKTSKKNLVVKTVPVNDPGRNERKYINCLKAMGKKLTYNKPIGKARQGKVFKEIETKRKKIISKTYIFDV